MKDGIEDRFKLKKFLVPHRKRDGHKEMIRKDSTIAQFCDICVVLSIMEMFRFYEATINVKHAYLQGSTLPRETYIQPSKA